ALRHIYLELVLPDAGVVATDPITRYRASVATFGAMKGVDGREIAPHAELGYLDTDGPMFGGPHGEEYAEPMTVQHLVGGRTGRVTLPLRGRLLLHELSEDQPFVSKAMLRQQDALNTASTEMRIVNDDAG